MKAHIVTLLIVDHDELGAQGVTEALEWTKYPNRCISPAVKAVQTYDVGEWGDDHPLNKSGTDAMAFLAALTPEEVTS